MAEANGVYSFLDVNASISGAGIVAAIGAGSGVAEEGITIAPATDKNTMTIGADGSGMHSLHANKAGQVTVRLLKTSPTNRLLENAYNLQGASSALWGQNTITVNNPLTGDMIVCRFCAFKKSPDIVYAVEGGMNEWTFDSTKIDRTLGSGSPALNAAGL